ncbi:MAG: alpha/beta fold hydrolase [Gaiellaceae bacterium]
MAIFALVHGGGGSAWDWHLVAAHLSKSGHEPVAVDLPNEDASAGWWDYADTVVEAVGGTTACSRPEWARRHARERLGIEADEMDGGHYIMLSRPLELATRLAEWCG